LGTDLGVPRWNDPEARTSCYRLDGGETQSSLGTSLGTYYLFIILNADFNPQRVSFPPPQGKRRWYRAIDTSLENGQDFLDFAAETPLDPQDVYLANLRSTVALVAR
jgi:isoamylase